MENNQQPSTLSDLAEQAFGRRVRALRVSAGMTQADLAEKMTHLGVNMRQGMIAKLERGARPTPVGEVTVLANVLDVSPSALLVSEDALPREITTLLDLRMNAVNTAAYLQELIAQSEQIQERIEMKRDQLRSTVKLFDKTLAIVTENHGAEWLASQGLENVSLARSPLFVELGAYGDSDGPDDEYVKSQLRG
jgi:transcriptional regulator with XRE-family HTH domain